MKLKKKLCQVPVTIHVLMAFAKMLYLRCLAGFCIHLCYHAYLFENLPVTAKHEFHLASGL